MERDGLWTRCPGGLLPQTSDLEGLSSYNLLHAHLNSTAQHLGPGQLSHSVDNSILVPFSHCISFSPDPFLPLTNGARVSLSWLGVPTPINVSSPEYGYCLGGLHSYHCFFFFPSVIQAADDGKEFCEFLPRLWHESSGKSINWGGGRGRQVLSLTSWGLVSLPGSQFLQSRLDIFIGCQVPRGSGQGSSCP